MDQRYCDWFQSSSKQEDNIADYANNYNLGAVVRNRTGTATNGQQYGGVALFYKKSKVHMVEFPLINPENYEVLAFVGSVHSIKGKVFVHTCYEPLNLTRGRAESMHEYLVDIVTEAKHRFQDCTVIIGEISINGLCRIFWTSCASSLK